MNPVYIHVLSLVPTSYHQEIFVFLPSVDKESDLYSFSSTYPVKTLQQIFICLRIFLIFFRKYEYLSCNCYFKNKSKP